MFYLMRHGEAGWGASTDFERKLTAQGELALLNSIELNKDHLRQISKIITSPYLRTQQTAQIVANNITSSRAEDGSVQLSSAPVPVILDANLTPSHSVIDAIKAIESHWCENLLVVTHQPLIGNLVSYLEQGEHSFSEPVSPGSIYCYAMEWPGPGCGLRQSLFFV